MSTLNIVPIITNLLVASMGRAAREERSMLEFVSETVAGYVEEGSIMSKDDALSLFQDSGLSIDEDDMVDLANTIEIITKRAAGVEEEGLYDGESDEEEIDDGTCELCERFVSRSFHHLVPKETHNRYLSKGSLPVNLVSIGELSRVWLNKHGVMVCRTCHGTIHNAERNEVLAEQYNTLDRLLEHPKIYAFAKYNSTQPCRMRVRKSTATARNEAKLVNKAIH
jgi:hypothetical protein